MQDSLILQSRREFKTLDIITRHGHLLSLSRWFYGAWLGEPAQVRCTHRKVLAYLKMCPSTYPPMLVDGTLLVISTPLVVIV